MSSVSSAQPESTLHRIELHDGWRAALRADGPSGLPTDADRRALAGFEAQVPGQVHDDLQRHGFIPDPLLDENEARIAWVGHADWRWSRPLERPAGRYDRIDLVFDGIDTASTVRIGGTEVGNTENMHRRYRFDVTDQLSSSALLEVDIESPYSYTEALIERFGTMPGPYQEPFGLIRKMACSFGWDWGPTVVSAGLWRGVRLETWSTARIESVVPTALWVDARAQLDVHLNLERTDSCRVLARIEVVGPNVSTSVDVEVLGDRADIPVPVSGASAWWPRGYGEQPLYDVVVSLVDSAGVLLDRSRSRVGFRTVTIDTTPDAAGSAFIVCINDEPIQVRGFNWIPGDVLPSRMTSDRYRQAINSAVDANANALRVWGGGIYEDDEFYAICDEAGVLVWQDFLFACSAYPEEDPIRSEVLAEARDNVTRLAEHPSLITWVGNNENLWLHDQDGWERELNGRPWGSAYYLDLLPHLLDQLDPSRPYLAGSPWSGSTRIFANSPDHGTHHSWEVWNREDYVHYRDSNPRFVSEFGWQAPPAWRTLRDAVDDDPLTPRSPGVLAHQKAENGQEKLAKGLREHFGTEPRDFDSWHLLTQLVQARAVSAGIEHWRSQWPHTAGTILWQLNDLWPVSSWAVIDSAQRRKPVWHAVRRAYADRLLTFERRDGDLVLSAVNMSPDPWSGHLDLALRDEHGSVLRHSSEVIEVGARSVLRRVVPRSADITDPAAQFLSATMSGADRALWFDVEDHAFHWQPPRYRTEVLAGPGGSIVRVTAETLVRDLLLQADRLPANTVVDAGFVTLMPGETHEYHLSHTIAKADLARPFVLITSAEVLARQPATGEEGSNRRVSG